MTKATTFESASCSSPPMTKSSATQPGKMEASSEDLSADNVQVRHLPATVRCPWSVRRLRTRRGIHTAAASIPPAQSESVLYNSELIQLKVKLHPYETLDIEVGVDDEPQEVVDPRVTELRITVSKLKSVRMVVPLDPNTSRLQLLADVCCEHLLAMADVTSPSDKS